MSGLIKVKSQVYGFIFVNEQWVCLIAVWKLWWSFDIDLP